MLYRVTLELEVVDSGRSSKDTRRRAVDAADKIAAYAARLRFVAAADLAGRPREVWPPPPPTIGDDDGTAD